MTDSKKIVLNVTEQSLSQIHDMADKLKTTPAGTISQALALLSMVQGKKVVIKDTKTGKDLIINTYSENPAQNENT